MKIKFHYNSNFESKKDFFIDFLPTLAIGWQKLSYRKYFSLGCGILHMNFWIEIDFK